MTRAPGRARIRRAPRRGPRPRPGRLRSFSDRRLAGIIAGILLLGVLAAGWILAGPGPAAPRGESTDVVLPAGARLPSIAATLADAHVISSSPIFILAAEITGAASHLQAGEYQFASHAPMWRVLAAIRSGAVVRRFVTVPEGVAVKTVVEILQRTEFLTGDLLTPAEGAVLPETYEVRRGESRASVLARMTAARDRLLTRLWRDRAPGLPYRNPEDAVILASIVERETALPLERPHIAGLFVNRLRKGMRLESDPTVIYGLTGGTPLGHGLRVSELENPTPYNTYKISGLPPTPIGNPGRAALEAALRPLATNDLYFVADGTGGHVFAASLEAHLKNVAHWRVIEKTRATTVTP